MEKSHEKSNLIPFPELTGLWEVPNTQESIIRTYYEMVEAKGNLESSNILKFETGSERDFIDLAKSYVEIQFQVLCAAQDWVKADVEKVGMTNHFAHGMFKRITLTDKSGRPLSNLDEQFYPYQAMLLTLLEKSPDWAGTPIDPGGPAALEGFYKDHPGRLDNSSLTDPYNYAFISRQKIITGPTGGPAPTVTVVFKPILGIMRQHRLMLNNMGLRLSLEKSKPEFVYGGSSCSGIKAPNYFSQMVRTMCRINPCSNSF